MSRIGNKVITLPAGVEITNNDNVVTVKGPKGELTREFNKNIEIKVEGNEVTLHRPNDSKENKTIHGTSRANLNNMVVGVSEGFKKELEMHGVGYLSLIHIWTKFVLIQIKVLLAPKIQYACIHLHAIHVQQGQRYEFHEEFCHHG